MNIESTVVSGAFNVLAVADPGAQVAAVMLLLIVAVVFTAAFSGQSGNNQGASTSHRQSPDNKSSNAGKREPSLRNERYFERNAE